MRGPRCKEGFDNVYLISKCMKLQGSDKPGRQVHTETEQKPTIKVETILIGIYEMFILVSVSSMRLYLVDALLPVYNHRAARVRENVTARRL